MAEEEMAVIQSIFCGPDEYELLSMSTGIGTCKKSPSTFRVSVKCYHQEAEDCVASGSNEGPTDRKLEPITIDSTFTLPSNYPVIIPDISLSSTCLSRNVCQRIRNDLLEYANTLEAEPMIMELVEWLKEHGSNYVVETKDCDDGLTSRTKEEESHVAVLHLDHMRSKNKYIKTLLKWANELALGGGVIFYGNLILILLEGSIANVKEFIVRLRTQRVDVDLGGRSCKERMMRVIVDEPHPSHEGRHCSFEVMDYKSGSKIEELFRNANLFGIYRTLLLPEFQLLR